MKTHDTNLASSWVSLATFDRPGKAKALKVLLENNRIEARITDERKLQRYWFLARPRAGIHVEVPAESLETAQKCVATKTNARIIYKEALHCPACNSSRVQYPAMTRKNILPTVVAQILVLLRVTHHEFYCEDCHYTWTRFGRQRGQSSSHVAAKAAVAGTRI